MLSQIKQSIKNKFQRPYLVKVPFGKDDWLYVTEQTPKGINPIEYKTYREALDIALAFQSGIVVKKPFKIVQIFKRLLTKI